MGLGKQRAQLGGKCRNSAQEEARSGPEGMFLAGSGCRLENTGAVASILVDFGRELHGGVRFVSGAASSRDIKVRHERTVANTIETSISKPDKVRLARATTSCG